jgi:hypothetical protein
LPAADPASEVCGFRALPVRVFFFIDPESSSKLVLESPVAIGASAQGVALAQLLSREL